MGISNAARSRAASAASKARADIAKSTSELSGQRALYGVATLADKVVRTVTSPSFIATHTAFARDFTAAQVAGLQAKIDDLNADKASAEARLSMAEGTLKAVDKTISQSADISDKASAMAQKAQDKVRDLTD